MPSPTRPSAQEAEKLNSLLKCEPNSTLANVVGFPVSSVKSLQNKPHTPALAALLAAVRARSRTELLDAATRLHESLSEVLLPEASASMDASPLVDGSSRSGDPSADDILLEELGALNPLIGQMGTTAGAAGA